MSARLLVGRQSLAGLRRLRQLAAHHRMPLADIVILLRHPQTGLFDQGLLRVASPFIGRDLGADFLRADRAQLADDGRFELLGRSDAIVKIAGKRVSLPSIEARIRACVGVAEAAVIAVPVKSRVRDLAIWAPPVEQTTEAER